jgi:hypothetical protein
MKRTIILSAIVLILITISLAYFVAGRNKKADPSVLSQSNQNPDAEMVAAPGRVEPVSEEI